MFLLAVIQQEEIWTTLDKVRTVHVIQKSMSKFEHFDVSIEMMSELLEISLIASLGSTRHQLSRRAGWQHVPGACTGPYHV
jgi:TolB-like protein